MVYLDPKVIKETQVQRGHKDRKVFKVNQELQDSLVVKGHKD